MTITQVTCMYDTMYDIVPHTHRYLTGVILPMGTRNFQGGVT